MAMAVLSAKVGRAVSDRWVISRSRDNIFAGCANLIAPHGIGDFGMRRCDSLMGGK